MSTLVINRAHLCRETNDEHDRKRFDAFNNDHLNKVDAVLQECNDEPIFSIRDALHSKYKRLTRIIEVDNRPEFCYFYEEEDEYKPRMDEYFPVLQISWSLEFDPFDKCKSLWKHISEKAMDGLYALHMCARGLYRRLIYDYKLKKWVKRNSFGDDDENITHLIYYHDSETMNKGDTLMEYLSRGRSAEEMAKTLKEMLTSSMDVYQTFQTKWQVALCDNMTSGEGLDAVKILLDKIISFIATLDQTEVFPNCSPKLSVINVTSSICQDSFSTVSSPSVTVTGSDDAPAPKHRRCSSGTSKPKKENSKEDQPKIVLCGGNKKYTDLKVACIDSSNGNVKYMLVVGIHSTGKTFEAALSKFCHDTLATLQAQDQIFGLFFSTLKVVLLTFTKQAGGRIRFSEKRYDLGRQSTSPMVMFNVNSFQLLIMDIFSLLVHGIKTM